MASGAGAPSVRGGSQQVLSLQARSQPRGLAEACASSLPLRVPEGDVAETPAGPKGSWLPSGANLGGGKKVSSMALAVPTCF